MGRCFFVYLLSLAQSQPSNIWKENPPQKQSSSQGRSPDHELARPGKFWHNSRLRNLQKRKQVINRRELGGRQKKKKSLYGGPAGTGTPTRTDGLEKCRLSAFKPLVVSAYNVCNLYQHGNTHQVFTGCRPYRCRRRYCWHPRITTWLRSIPQKSFVWWLVVNLQQGGEGILMSR